MAYLDNVTNILQIQPDGLPTYVRLNQNENGRNLYFELQGNEIDIPSNATVTISGTKPDGTVYSGIGSVTDNVVLIPEMLQMTAVAGTWDAKIQITSGGNTIATGRVRFVVDADTVAPGSVPSDSELEGLVAQAQQYAETARTEAYGSPLTAGTAAGMTDHTRVYVYTGSESGYTAGHWYFWNGSAWTDGGIYNSVAVNTDTTLTLMGVAADAKATGDAIAAVTIPTDKTLSVSDAPADAKVVGDELDSLKSDLSESVGDLKGVITNLESAELDGTIDIGLEDLSFVENSAVNSSTGEFYELTNYDRTGYVDVSNFISLRATKDISSYCLYDSNKNRLSGGQNVAPNTSIETNGAKYIAICIAHGVQTTIGVTAVSKTLAYKNLEKINGLTSYIETLGDNVETLGDDVTSIQDKMPVDYDEGSYVEINNTANTQTVSMKFQALSENRVYCGGENLCDGTIERVALGSYEVLVSNSYVGLIVPIKGGEKYTICRSAKSSSRFRFGITKDYPANHVATLGNTRDKDDALSYTYDTSNHPDARYLVVYLSNSGEDVSGTNFWVVRGTSAGAYSPYSGQLTTTSGTALTKNAAAEKTVCWCDSGNIKAGVVISVNQYVDKKDAVIPSASNTGNFSIVCAKEHSYVDGTPPCIEYFLVEECGTKKFYFTKDFSRFSYAFTFDGVSYNYTFGILANGDVIACILADALENGKSDSHRKNPYCWLASEKWEIQHEVDFETDLKPCGWLSNCGFRVLADYSAMFVEYTRMTVATANVWKITGNPSVASNWVVKKSFEITTEDNLTGFKHIHMVVQDFYNGTIYISTGDDDDNSKIWYSSDGGDTWTQLGIPSQKYCRNLMLIFTKNYIYWAADSWGEGIRYLFRAPRDANGVLDFANKTDYIFFGGDNGIAAYGLSYIPELNAMLILDRADGVKASIPIKLVDLTNETYVDIGTLEAPSGTNYVGLRTRFSEWYPHNGMIRFGFAFKIVQNFDNVNHNKGFGNVGYSNTGEGLYNINNLVMQVYKNADGFGFVLNTMY